MMKLGIISHYAQPHLEKVHAFGLSHVEFCINRNHEDFLNEIDAVKHHLDIYKLSMLSLGRWGTERLTHKGINPSELEIDIRLIEAAHKLGTPVYVVGCNKVEGLSLEAQLGYAISYLKALKEVCDGLNMQLAIYNCRWGNFITGPETWNYVINQIPGIGIKYDPSHAIRDHQDYLQEVLDFGKYIYHIHLKGSLKIGEQVVDDPPAGLDSTDWASFMALLYVHGYQGGLSIEPHSKVWTNKLGDSGIAYTKSYFEKMIMED